MPQPASDRLRRVTSRQNSQVKALRGAFHDAQLTEDGACAVEGVRLIEEAIRSGLHFRCVFVRESAQARVERLLPQLAAKVEVLLLPDEVFDSAVSTESPQGVAALVYMKARKLEDLLGGQDSILVVAAGVQDPGNLGTMIRSAEAFGAQGMALVQGTVSPYNPKAIRAAAGSSFRLPVVSTESGVLIEHLRASGYRLVATSSHQGTELDRASLTGAAAVFIGNEGAGLPRALASAMDEVIVIPHAAKVESLNAGVAAAVVLYEAARQRRRK